MLHTFCCMFNKHLWPDGWISIDVVCADDACAGNAELDQQHMQSGCIPSIQDMNIVEANCCLFLSHSSEEQACMTSDECKYCSSAACKLGVSES